MGDDSVQDEVVSVHCGDMNAEKGISSSNNNNNNSLYLLKVYFDPHDILSTLFFFFFANNPKMSCCIIPISQMRSLRYYGFSNLFWD